MLVRQFLEWVEREPAGRSVDAARALARACLLAPGDSDDRAAMEAAWELGAWDVARAERKGCMRPGAPSTEALECLQAFGAFPFGVNGSQVVVADAPDADELLQLAASRGYLMWLFRPVSGGIWAEVADDATLTSKGRRPPPCPHRPIPPRCDGNRKTVYRFGISANTPAGPGLTS